MDPTQLLKRQHRQVESLFKKLHKAEDAGERRELVEQIRNNLALHMRLEEEIFYPAVRQVETKKAGEMVLEAYEEHHVAKLALAELPNVDPDDERFDAKVTVLEELIQHHVEEEEKEMFKLAKRLGREELGAIGEQMNALAGEDGGGATAEDLEETTGSSGAARGRRKSKGAPSGRRAA
jgi:hemerythrin superfamily protein